MKQAHLRTRILFEVRATHFRMLNLHQLWYIIELINLVRHLRAYPSDSLEVALRNIFDFDIYKPETIEKLADILDHHG